MTFLVFAAACVAGAEVAQYFPSAVPGSLLFPLWPPTGILLAVLVRREPREWYPWLAVAGLSLAVVLALHGYSWPTVAAAPALTLVDAAAGAFILKRSIDGPFSLTRVAHVWALMLVAATVPMLSGLVVAGTMQLASDVPFLVAWRGWWFASALGLLLFGACAAAILDGPEAFVERPGRWAIVEAVLVVASATVVAWLVFGAASPVLRVPAYVLPFLLWAAFRLGPGGAVATLLAVCLIGLFNTSRGDGPFALIGAPIGDWILRSQGAVTTASLSILLLASVVAERKQTARERTALLEELQLALLEIKTLRGLIPICAWCQNVRDDAGFWQGIEDYVHTHTGATFSHSICPTCANQMDGTIAEMRHDRPS